MPEQLVTMTKKDLDENTICDFLKQGIQDLKEITPIANHQWDLTKITRKENGYQIKFSTKPDFGFFIERNSSYISSIKKFAIILEADVRYQNLLRNTTEELSEIPDWLKAERILQLILSQYVGQLNQLKYEEIWAKKIAKNFSRSLEDQKSVVIRYSVVHGLECDFESYTLPGDIQLRRLTDEQIEQLIERNRMLLEHNNIPDNRCLVEQRFQCDTTPQHQTINTAHENFDLVITALRLLKEGRVERQNTYSRLEHLGELYLAQKMGTLGRINQRYPISNTYTLSEADLPVLKEILQAIKLGSIPTRLRTAVDRVNFAGERDRPDDQLLDLLIAMEAIFGDESGAIGYKIGMRCAIFVENNPENRDDIFNLIKEAYDRRSALVHGNKRKSKSKLTTSEIVEKLLYFIQKSIQYIIQRLLAGESVPKGEDFDKMLLKRGYN